MKRFIKILLVGIAMINLSLVISADEIRETPVVEIELGENEDTSVEVCKKPIIEDDDGTEDGKPLSGETSEETK